MYARGKCAAYLAHLATSRPKAGRRTLARVAVAGMDTEVDLTTADRGVLIAIIAQLQATVLEQQRVIERLQRRIAELEGQAKPGVPPRMPGLIIFVNSNDRQT